jgi:4-methylaminobutanoate oxidase (formaldehyde-forming)
MTAPLPSHAEIVVIGGGIVGCSTAYHLARAGAKDVVLLERAKLTSGSTFHAAGLVGQLRSSASVTRLLKHSVELYDTLEAETGQATGWKRNGGLRLACNAERMIEIRRQATTARSFGLEMHLLTPSEAKELWPLMDESDLVGAAFLPTDGQANPSDITQALAKGARMRGVRILEDTAVTAIEVKDGRVAAVVTAAGRIACDKVVNCAGQWAREVGGLAGVTVPLCSVEHQYLISEPFGVPANLPTLRDPDRLIYFKEEVGGLVMGGYEPNPIPWAVDGIPAGFHFSLLPSNFDHFEQISEQALARCPSLATAGVRQLLNGPESFTPDGNFILGEAPEVRGFFVGAGFNAFGIASGGGAGWALAEWVLTGAPPLDLWPVDIRRFSRVHADEAWVRERTLEMYGKHYTIVWPFEEYASARPALTSPIYERLKAAGACFGSKLGWERPNWFAPPGVDPVDRYSFGRQNWFSHVGEEHRAVRERVGLFDQTSFAKLMITGPDAEAALSWASANDVRRPPGRLVYTTLLNERGGIESDLVLARLADDAYYAVIGTGFRTHDIDVLRRAMPAGARVAFEDVTEAMGVLALMGPRSREVLAAVTDADVSNAAFPFYAHRELAIAGATVRALRLTFVGELGYELHMPREHMAAVYDALMAAGAAHGIANAGYRALDSLRLEKGYRVWGADLSPDHTPFEAGLGWSVKLTGNVPFRGREALVEQQGRPLAKRFVGFAVADPEVVLLGRETIYRDGAPVGYLSSGGFGYTVGKAIGYGYVRNAEGIADDWLAAGQYELDVACERIPAAIALEPFYDPRGTRVTA